MQNFVTYLASAFSRPLVIEAMANPEESQLTAVMSTYFDWCNCPECGKVSKPLLTDPNPEGRYFASYTDCEEHGWLTCHRLRQHRDLDQGMRAVAILSGAACHLLKVKIQSGRYTECPLCVENSHIHVEMRMKEEEEQEQAIREKASANAMQVD